MADDQFTCSTCDQAKEADFFYWFDGKRVPSCKACRSEKSRSAYAANRESSRERAYERLKLRKAAGGPEWEASKKSQRISKLRWRANNPSAHLLATARCRARSRGIECTIAVSDIPVPELCPALGTELKVVSGTSGNRRHIATLDRIDSSKGYVPGNVQVISHLANTMKNSATREELISFANWVLATFRESA